MQKVMIVEDDPKIADLLKSHIVKYGYNVHVVKDFDRVIDEFRRTKAAAIRPTLQSCNCTVI